MTPADRIRDEVARMERSHRDIFDALRQILDQLHGGRVEVDPQEPIPQRGIVFEFDEHSLKTIIRFKRDDEP